MNKTEKMLLRCDSEALYEHLASGKDINTPDADGCLKLVEAARTSNSIAFIKEQLRMGADIFKRDSSGLNAVEAAFLNEYGNMSILKTLVKDTPLSEKLDFLRRICTAEKPLKKTDIFLYRFKTYQNGITPLIAAVLFNRPASVIQSLIDTGEIDINARDSDGWTALRYAVSRDNFKIIKLLIKNGADVNTRDNDGDMFAEDIFFIRKKKEILPLLRFVLKNGATEETVNRLWSVLADTSMFFNNKPSFMLKIIRLLLKAGADINHQCDTGLVLNEAVKFSGFSVVKHLLKHGANPNLVDASGCTALIAHSYEARPDARRLVKALIEAGADPYFKYVDESNPEYSHTFMDCLKNDAAYYDEVAALYEKEKKEKKRKEKKKNG